MKVTVRRVLRGAFLILALAVAAGAIYEQIGQRRDRVRLPQVGRSVDIGGSSLNIFCSGEGSPAVIFDSGANESGYAWSHIQPQVAKLTRACWFDRAGYGWSDKGPFPRDTRAASLDLHLLLQNAGIAPPYIMVGHSLGGLNTRVYNGMFPHDLAGAVLVDAAHEDEPRRAPAFMLGHSAPRVLWRPIWVAAEAARICGLIRLLAPRRKLPDDTAKRTRRDVVIALRLQPKTLATMADASTPDSYAQAEASGGFGNLPLTVLTRGKFLVSPQPTAMEREQQAYEQVWMHEIQPKLAKLSTRGRQIIVETSGHDIPEEAPDVIVEAVREQLAVLQSQAGARSSSGPR